MKKKKKEKIRKEEKEPDLGKFGTTRILVLMP